ncbi:MAG: hypothetical protein Q8N09_06690 [Thermodesulfovibrionia bacterium]|nr:hypothetical protein [Thermodesulfovibrionia bacterium]
MFKRILFLITATAVAGVIDLPQTGQTKCYDTNYDTNGVEIPCAGTGQDGEIRVGVFGLIFLLTTTGDSWLTNINQSERLINPIDNKKWRFYGEDS